MLASGKAATVATCVLGASFLGACSTERVDADRESRATWLAAIGADAGVGLRQFLNGNENVRYYRGFYPMDWDKSGAWRWMGRKGIIQLRTNPDHYPKVIDMQIEIFGWVPFDDSLIKKYHFEYSVNGHVLDEYDPDSAKLFSRKIFVPKELLEHSEWVDFVVNVSETYRPAGDTRDIGFATTGVFWTPAGPR